MIADGNVFELLRDAVGGNGAKLTHCTCAREERSFHAGSAHPPSHRPTLVHS